MSQAHAESEKGRIQDVSVREAEERAERAERKVEQLEKAVAGLSASEGEAKKRDDRRSEDAQTEGDAAEQLRRDAMMAHLMDALSTEQNIGHYGRLVFAMVAHHFMEPEEVLTWLRKDPDLPQNEAEALLRQVESRNYNPPRRERIVAWQSEQDFPIIPRVDDPDCGNVYRTLKFPERVYEHIEEYQEEKMHVGNAAGERARGTGVGR